jgi:hypothetical protein
MQLLLVCKKQLKKFCLLCRGVIKDEGVGEKMKELIKVEVKDFLAVSIILFLLGLSGGLMYINRSEINSTIMVAIFALSLVVVISIINLLVNKEKWSETAFGLPKNSIRASIVLVFVAMVVLIGLNFADVKSYQELPEWLLVLVGAVVGFYFGERKSQYAVGYVSEKVAWKEGKTVTGEPESEEAAPLPDEEKPVAGEAIVENVTAIPEGEEREKKTP